MIREKKNSFFSAELPTKRFLPFQDPKGYYNGRTKWEFDPFRGLSNGKFSIPEECVKSDEELAPETRVSVIDPDNKEHIQPTRSWTYDRGENSWFYEPRAFTETR